MKLSIPCTWEPELIDNITALNRLNPKHPVTEVYGSLKASRIGSGHSAASIRGACLKKKDIENFVGYIHKQGLKFNYTINSSCLGNREYDPKGLLELHQELEWICSFSDSVTITIPFLLEMAKQISAGKVEIVASVIAGIDSLRKINYFQELGANRIVLDISLNRKPALIKEIRAKTPVLLELLVNDSCLLECPYRYYHYNTGSHGSYHKTLFYLDYCVYHCTLRRLENPVEILRSPWLRPEDLTAYQNEIDIVKLAGREKSTAWVTRAINAYARGSYEGNILDLLTIVTPASHELGAFFLGKVPEFQLNNRRLDSYMERFFSQNYHCRDCNSCNYCRNFAQANLQYDQNEVETYLTKVKKFGALFFGPSRMGRASFWVLKVLLIGFVKDSLLWRKMKPILKSFMQRWG